MYVIPQYCRGPDEHPSTAIGLRSHNAMAGMECGASQHP